MSRHQVHEPSQIAIFRKLFDGCKETTIAEFRKRWQSPEVSTSNQVSHRIIPVQNELTPILEKRIEAMPQALSFQADKAMGGKESDAKELNTWLWGEAMGYGRSFQSTLQEIAEDMEIGGTAAMVMGLDEAGKVWARLRDPAGMAVEADPMNPMELVKAEFCWEVLDGNETRHYREEISKTGRRVFLGDRELPEERQEFALDFLPVVLFPRRQVKNSPLGDSALNALLEPYLSMLWALYLVNKHNRYAGKVWCPDGDFASTGWAFGDEDAAPPVRHRIMPDFLHPGQIKQVGSVDIPAGAMEQYREARDSLYRVGKVRRSDDGTDMRSGKAMLIDTQELRAYTDARLVQLRAGACRMADVYGWLTGRRQFPESLGMAVEIPDLNEADPQEQRERARLYAEGYKAGLFPNRLPVYEAWQRFNLIDEEIDVEAMAREADEEDAAKEAQRADQLAAALAAQGADEEDEEATGVPQAEDLTEEAEPDGENA